MEGEWASIGIKKETKELLNKISSEIVHELERWDLTWDDIILYLSYIYLNHIEKNSMENTNSYKYNIKEEIEKLKNKLKVVKGFQI
ncbi:MAG: hypothetical protein QXW48_03975 [Thermoplasmata archaeon]